MIGAAMEEYVRKIKSITDSFTDHDRMRASAMQHRMAIEQSGDPSDGPGQMHPFGTCPKCLREGLIRSFWKANFSFCHCCKKKWEIGYNIFGAIWPENDAEWMEEALFFVATYDYERIDDLDS